MLVTSGDSSWVPTVVSSPVTFDGGASSDDTSEGGGWAKVQWVDTALGITIVVSYAVAACRHTSSDNSWVVSASSSIVGGHSLVGLVGSLSRCRQWSDVSALHITLSITIVVSEGVSGTVSVSALGRDTSSVPASLSSVVTLNSVANAVVADDDLSHVLLSHVVLGVSVLVSDVIQALVVGDSS